MRSSYHVGPETVERQLLPDQESACDYAAAISRVSPHRTLLLLVSTAFAAALVTVLAGTFKLYSPVVLTAVLVLFVFPNSSTRAFEIGLLGVTAFMVVSAFFLFDEYRADFAGTMHKRLSAHLEAVWLLLGFLAAIIAFAKQQPRHLIAVFSLTGLAVVILLKLLDNTTLESYTVLFLTALVVTFVISDAIVVHWINILRAQARLAPQIIIHTAKINSLTYRILSGHYLIALIVLAMLFRFSVFLLSRESESLLPLKNAHAMLLTTAAFVLVALVYLCLTRSPLRIATTILAIGKAIVSWCCYNGNPYAKGVHLDGYLVASRLRRRVLTCSSVFLFAFALCPVAFYFALTANEATLRRVAYSENMPLFLTTYVSEWDLIYRLERFEPQPDLGQVYTSQTPSLLAYKSNLRRNLVGFLESNPENILLVSIDGVLAGEQLCLWTLLIATATSTIVPIAILLSVITIVCKRRPENVALGGNRRAE